MTKSICTWILICISIFALTNLSQSLCYAQQVSDDGLAGSIQQITQAKNQTVVWADKVLGFSSQNGEKAFSAMQVLGKPNVSPEGGISSVAWMPDMRSGLDEEWIKVGFNSPIHVQQIAIVENARPGAITKIFLFDENNNVLSVYLDTTRLKQIENGVIPSKAKDQIQASKKGAIWSINVDSTEAKITALLLVIHPKDSIAIHQIDAIGISPFKSKIEAGINLRPGLDSIPEPVNLGVGINSFFDEIFPVISPDGNILFFDRKNHPGNYASAEGRKNNDDIWYSLKDAEGKWLRAKNIGPPLNNGYHNFVCSISPDNNTMLLGNAYQTDGTLKNGLSITYRDSAGWTFPRPLNIHNYYNTNDYAEFQLAANGKVIIMAIQREDTRGRRDLYAVFRMGPSADGQQRWTAPIHLGPDINSAGLEMSPFLASDMVTLYFSSNGFPGFGDNDMFVTKRLDESWTRWSEPVNLGPVINSSKLDAYYTIPASGEYAYFASSNKSIGRTDLFSIPLPEDIRPDPVVLIRGKVLEQDIEALNREVPVRASITWSAIQSAAQSATQMGDHSGIAGSDPADGRYKIVLPYGQLYEFRAEAEGYFALNETINLKAIDNYQELEVDLYLIPIRKGEIIPIRDIYFEVNRAVLLDQSDRELSRVSAFLTDNPLVSIEIAGHTNDRCSEAFCQQLSDRRAKSVSRYLTGRGIDPERISYKGYGSAEPIADNETEDGRALNQRVEFRITSTDGIRTNKKKSGK